MNYTLLFFLLLFGARGFAQPNTDTLIRGVRISFEHSSGIFPLSWQKNPISAVSEPIEPEEMDRCKKIMARALDKYPADLLKKELKEIFFLKSMKFYNVSYGGTNSNNALYITNNGTAKGYTDRYLEQTFHHEFSSILYRNHPSFFRKSEWTESNSEDFFYNDPERGVGAIRNNRSSQDFDTLLCEKGLLTEYASSGLENDLNTFAQSVFNPPPRFWDIVEIYPRIRKKVSLLIDFYQRIHPIFTLSYFRNFIPK